MLRSTTLGESSSSTAAIANSSNDHITGENSSTATFASSQQENAAEVSVQHYNDEDAEQQAEPIHSAAPVQLAAGILQIFEPQMLKARGHLKELIAKQNKVYIDLSAEKYKLDNADVAALYEMMNQVRIYREKIIKIKKRMENIYQRTNVMKKRAANIQASKQKELQRKIQKQHLEESLIAKQQQERLQQQQQQQSQEHPKQSEKEKKQTT